MSRSEAVRQEVLSLDDHRCQLTGARGADVQLNVHHVIPLGGGGSDTVENCITTAQSIHMAGVHPGVSVPTVRILHWDRTDKDGGLIVERREGAGDDWHEWPKSELWFYKRQDAEMLEKEIEMVRKVQLVESKHAQIMAHIWDNYQLISDAASPESYVAQLGVDSTHAQDEVDAVEWINRNGLEWPLEVNLKKIELLMSVDGIQAETAQRYLDGGKVNSYSIMRKNLIKEGLKLGVMRWYLLIGEHKRPLGRVQTDTLFVRSRDYEIVMNRMGEGVKVVEVKSFKAGITWDRKEQKLFDRNGKEISYETWEKET